MTFPKRPFPHRIRRAFRHVGQRVLVLLAVLLFAVTPSLTIARTIAAVSLERGARSAPAEAVEEEESLERAAPHRHGIEIRHGADRWQSRVVVAAGVFRHRLEMDGAAAARRWERYQAPPRAPPHRLLI